MAKLLTFLAEIVLVLLAKVDKAKYRQTVDDFYARVHADPCGVLVEQLGGKKQDSGSSDDTGAQQRKSG